MGKKGKNKKTVYGINRDNKHVITGECGWCQKTTAVYRPPSSKSHNKMMFCDRACRVRYDTKPSVPCNGCGELMPKLDRKSNKKIYCTRECFYKTRGQARYTLSCTGCGVELKFTKRRRHARLNKHPSGHVFCNLTCSTVYRSQILKLNDPMNFRELLTKVRNSSKHRKHPRKFRLTVKSLYELYNKQEGKCALTGIILPPHVSSEKTPYKPSIDRINSDDDYIVNNIQLVCVAANYMKNNYTQEETMKFITNIRTS